MSDAEPVAIRSDELQILLNLLDEARKPLVVSYPFYPVTLFTYDCAQGVVMSAVDDKEFDEARAERLPKPKRLQDDLPQWSDLRDAMLSSGVLAYANDAEAKATLRAEQQRARSANNPNPTILAFDTNTLYHRAPSRWLPHAAGENDHFQRAVSDGVRNELDRAITTKYSADDMQPLSSRLFQGREFGRMLNRPHKKGRKAKLGLAEARAIDKRQNGVRCPAPPLTESKEENDRLIAKSYAALRDSARAHVLLLTSDQTMQDHALNAGLQPVLLQLPPAQAIPAGPLDERTLCRFIHDLAVSFGALRLVGADMTLWAEWSGKTPADADAETLHILGGTGELMTDLQRDLALSREIESAAAVR